MSMTHCAICGKGPLAGAQVSHAHNVSSKRRFPNIQRVRAVINGAPRHIHVCTRCLRSGKVQKAV
jgi:large subunit ribosomal protein L28